jgi:regulator of RNase E activity RraA
MKTDIINELEKFDIETISDALNTIGLCTNIYNLKYTVEDKLIVGEAYTVEFITDNYKDKCLSANYIDDVPENSIIVIDNHNIDYCTVWGNILSRMAQIKNVKGTVINGAMRDYKKSKELNYPVFSKHINCKTGKGVVRLKSVNESITIDNIPINPNDYIVLQNSIMLVIPANRVEEVIRISNKIEEMENNILKAINNNSTLKEARERYKYDDIK